MKVGTQVRIKIAEGPRARFKNKVADVVGRTAFFVTLSVQGQAVTLPVTDVEPL